MLATPEVLKPMSAKPGNLIFHVEADTEAIDAKNYPIAKMASR